MQILGPAQELVAQNLQGIFNNKALGGCGLPNISELSLNPLGELGEKRETGLTQGCHVGRMLPFAVGKICQGCWGEFRTCCHCKEAHPGDGAPR